MKLFKPAYFDDFRCIADKCPDSCCKEWDVQVDDAAAEFYRQLPGALGDRLRQVLALDDDGDTVMIIENGRCPMWRQDGLCRIQAEFGHDALCKTCREFPRLTHDYGDFIERGLELSCPVAAQMILSAPPAPFLLEEVPGGEEPEYDEEAMQVLLRTRKEMLALLYSRQSIAETLTLTLMYGYHAQAQLDGEPESPFDSEAALESARNFAKPAKTTDLPQFYAELEILTEAWRQHLSAPSPAPWSEPLRALARYGVERYWLQAVSDYDLVGRVKMIIASCLLVKESGGNPFETAQLYSKEIENNADNVDAILDATYSHPAFTDDKLLWLLLKRRAC